MTLAERINEDLKASMKAQDAPRTGVLRMAKAALMNREIDKKGALTDDETVKVLQGLVRHRRIAMLYITHDLLSARLLADEVLVLHQGAIVERGPTARVVREARHEYTRTLLDAIPNPFSAHADREPVSTP